MHLLQSRLTLIIMIIITIMNRVLLLQRLKSTPRRDMRLIILQLHPLPHMWPRIITSNIMSPLGRTPSRRSSLRSQDPQPRLHLRL